jgi:hypothetical protein
VVGYSVLVSHTGTVGCTLSITAALNPFRLDVSGRVTVALYPLNSALVDWNVHGTATLVTVVATPYETGQRLEFGQLTLHDSATVYVNSSKEIAVAEVAPMSGTPSFVVYVAPALYPPPVLIPRRFVLTNGRLLTPHVCVCWSVPVAVVGPAASLHPRRWRSPGWSCHGLRYES